MKAIISKNPFSGQIVSQIPFTTDEQVHTKLQLAKQDFSIQSHRQLKEKHSLIKEVTRMISHKKTELSKLITFQTGKPITESEFEVAETIKICEYYSRHREGILTQNIKTNAKKKTLIQYKPTGTIYCLLPWVNPFLLPFYKCLPQLLLGNGVLVRPSHSTPGVAKEVEKIMKKSGFQSGEYQTIWNTYDQSKLILEDEQISGVSFTGSTQKAAVVASLAGKYLKKTHISGSFASQMIILEDGDLQAAVENAFKTGHFNSGLGITPKQFIVHHKNYDQFRQLFIEKVKSLKYGDPEQRSTEIGPVSSELHSELTASLIHLPADHQIIYQRSEMKSPFLPLVVLQTNGESIQPIIGGPIFVLTKADSDEHCISIANKSPSTSASFIFSQTKWEQLANSLQTGSLFINNVCYFDPHVPLGRFGHTHCREGGYQGVRHFANIKTLFVN